MDFIPKAFAIKYSDILNNLLLEFISSNQDFFTRNNEDGIYVFSGKNSKTKLTRIFSEYLSKEIESITKSIGEKHKDIATRNIFILQGASPENNVLKNQYTGEIVPSRYFLMEKDIHMDFVLLEKIWSNIFDKKFQMKQRGRNHGVFFLKHQNLNADQLGNILATIFGIVEWSYDRKKEVLGDIAETTNYKYDGSKPMHDRIKMVIQETKDYIRQITHLETITVNKL